MTIKVVETSRRPDVKKEEPNIRRYCLFPKPFSKAAEAVLKPIYKKHGFAEHHILTEWRSIVGDELADFSIPQKLTAPGNQGGGTLHVLIASARALEFQHLQPVILDRISTYFGFAAVRKIKLTQSASDIFRRRKIKKEVPTPAISQKLLHTVSECEDEKLRNALLSLGSLLHNKY